MFKLYISPLFGGFFISLGGVMIIYGIVLLIMLIKRRLSHFAAQSLMLQRERRNIFQQMETELLQSPPLQTFVEFFDSLRNLPSLDLAKRLAAMTGDGPEKQRILTEENVEECETCIICHDDLKVGESVPKIPHACFNVNFAHLKCLRQWWSQTIKNHLEIRCPFCSIDIHNCNNANGANGSKDGGGIGNGHNSSSGRNGNGTDNGNELVEAETRV